LAAKVQATIANTNTVFNCFILIGLLCFSKK